MNEDKNLPIRYVVLDKYDERVIADGSLEHEPLKAVLDQFTGIDLRSVQEACDSFYGSFYRRNPQFTRQPGPFQVLFDVLSRMPEYRSLHLTTGVDEAASIIATGIMAHKFLRREEQPTKAGGKRVGNQSCRPTPPCACFGSASQGKLRQALRDALKAIEDSPEMGYKDALDAMGGISWGTEEGDRTKADWRKSLAFARLLHEQPDLIHVIRQMGREIASLLHQQATKSTPDREDVVSVTLGNDLARTLCSERVLLLRPLFKLLFYRRFMEAYLLQYETSGKVPKEKGPVVMCLDESGSMFDDGEPSRIVKAKAVAGAVALLCRKQKRSVAVVHFGCQSEIHVQHYRKGRLSDADLLSILTFAFRGGTDFETPLKRAMAVIDTDRGFDRADIAFVTDGECGISQDFVKKFNVWRKERGVVMRSFLFQDCNSLASVSDEQHQLWRKVGEIGWEEFYASL